jgi:hypothetical protein
LYSCGEASANHKHKHHNDAIANDNHNADSDDIDDNLINNLIDNNVATSTGGKGGSLHKACGGASTRPDRLDGSLD